MKPSDLITTSEQMNAMSQALIQTEMTDAVNAGIVDRADKSAHSLKGRLYTFEKGSATGGANSTAFAAAIRRKDSRSTMAADLNEAGLPASDAAIDPLSPQGAALSGPTSYQTRQHLRKSLRGGQAARLKGTLAAAAAGQALEGTEFEGADDLYYKGAGGTRMVRGIRKRLSGKDALVREKTLGALSEKKAWKKAAGTVEAKRKAQAITYFKRTVYSTAAKTQTARAAAKGGATVIGTAVKGIAGAVGAAAAPVVLIFFSIVLCIGLIGAILGGSTETESAKVTGFGDLKGVQLEVAQALAAEGLGRAQIAAVMGNIDGESGWDPTAEYHGEGNGGGYEYGYGLFQFTDTIRGAGEYTNFANWCKANDKEIDSVAAQVQFFIKNLKSSWSTSLHRSGYYTKYITEYAGKDASYDAWLSTNDVGFATYCFMACWLRPADWAAKQSFYRDRLPAAKSFYEQLASSGGGQDYAAANETQKAIVDAANRTPSPGAGLCAWWVADVYENAGLGSLPGNACDMYRNWCHSTDRSELKVGMLVAVESSSSGTNAGRIYGHVGIYAGDGKVIHNTGVIETTDLDEWIATYCQWSPVGWGYPPNVA